MTKFRLLLVLLLVIQVAHGRDYKKSTYIELRVYHAADNAQLGSIEEYLQTMLLPSLEKENFNQVGVFKAIDSDTAKDKRIYVFIPFASLSQIEKLATIFDKTITNAGTSQAYARAAYNHPAFSRFETIILQTFESMPQVKPSGIHGDKSQSVYELRSYESATEALHQGKVRMFNTNEIKIFDRLGFNGVFYSRVIAGSRMPNLMYMTSFENRASREEHWKAFNNDPEWKVLKDKPENLNNVSHVDIVFLRPTAYSKL